jgi:hypothetical protein
MSEIEMGECTSEEYGPYHFWEVDGPNTVTCNECPAEGRIIRVE